MFYKRKLVVYQSKEFCIINSEVATGRQLQIHKCKCCCCNLNEGKATTEENRDLHTLPSGTLLTANYKIEGFLSTIPSVGKKQTKQFAKPLNLHTVIADIRGTVSPLCHVGVETLISEKETRVYLESLEAMFTIHSGMNKVTEITLAEEG